VIDDVPFHRLPRADAAPPRSQTGVAHNTGFNGIVAPQYQVIPKYFIVPVWEG
jgi:hypothetical protein